MVKYWQKKVQCITLYFFHDNDQLTFYPYRQISTGNLFIYIGIFTIPWSFTQIRRLSAKLRTYYCHNIIIFYYFLQRTPRKQFDNYEKEWSPGSETFKSIVSHHTSVLFRWIDMCKSSFSVKKIPIYFGRIIHLINFNRRMNARDAFSSRL